MEINKTKAFLLAGLLSLGIMESSAVSAYPGLMNVRQADGSELLIRRIGDEYCNIVVTSDGYPLAYNAKTLNYEYATFVNGSLKGSGIEAASPERRNTAAANYLASVNPEKEMTAFEDNWKAARAKSAPDNEPRSGSPKRVMSISDVPTTGRHDVLVILVDFENVRFSDNKGTPDPQAYYERFFHEKGFSEYGATGSAHDFYYDGSCGRYDPQFRVFGPVALKGTHSDYAGSGGTMNTYKLIEEAVRLVDVQYDVDFKDFDTDGDGKVDNVYCLYAGYGQADSGISDAIWPHASELHNRKAEFEVDGVLFDRYTVSQQVNGQTHEPVGIGTFVHEFGHVLGFADHYNTAANGMVNPVNNVGEWDVMAAGSYNNNQNTPPTFSAFERYSLGWNEPKELNPKLAEEIEMSPYIESGECYRVTVKPDDKEYFLIENRQKKGWDSYLPGHGILVWHIEESQSVWDSNRVNVDNNHQMVDIVEASGMLTTTGASSDSFPGSENVVSYAFTGWDGIPSFGFDWVEEDKNGNCRFLLSGTGYVIPSPELDVSDIMGTSASLHIDKRGPAESYEITLLKDGDKVMSETVYDAGAFPLNGLEPETEYTALAVAMLTTLKSDVKTVKFTTLPLQIEEKKAVALPAANVTDESFLARWQDMPEATDYMIDLYVSTHDGEGKLVYGFDDFSSSAQNLPEGWTLTAKQTRSESDFGESAPSLRLRDDGAALMMSVPGTTIDNVGFWFMPGKAGMVLTAEKCVEGEWSEIWTHVADRKKEFNISLETAQADSVRLVLSRKGGVTGGFVLVDDITLNYVYDRFTYERSIMAGPSYENAFATDLNGICSYVVDGLEPLKKYAYSLQALNGNRKSVKSDVVAVEPGMYVSVDELVEDAAEPVIYNLQGIRMRRAFSELPAGIYVINGKKVFIHR